MFRTRSNRTFIGGTCVRVLVYVGGQKIDVDGDKLKSDEFRSSSRLGTVGVRVPFLIWD